MLLFSESTLNFWKRKIRRFFNQFWYKIRSIVELRGDSTSLGDTEVSRLRQLVNQQQLTKQSLEVRICRTNLPFRGIVLCYVEYYGAYLIVKRTYKIYDGIYALSSLIRFSMKNNAGLRFSIIKKFNWWRLFGATIFINTYRILTGKKPLQSPWKRHQNGTKIKKIR